jgi:hypothetical protein
VADGLAGSLLPFLPLLATWPTAIWSASLALVLSVGGAVFFLVLAVLDLLRAAEAAIPPTEGRTRRRRRGRP